MTAPRSEQLPVYDRLVRERGDALAEVRDAAEQAKRREAELLGGNGLPHPAPGGYRDGGPGGP